MELENRYKGENREFDRFWGTNGRRRDRGSRLPQNLYQNFDSDGSVISRRWGCADSRRLSEESVDRLGAVDASISTKKRPEGKPGPSVVWEVLRC